MHTPKFGDFRRLYRAKPKPKTDGKGGPLEQGETTAITPDLKHDVSSFIVDRQKKNVFYALNEDGYTRARWLDSAHICYWTGEYVSEPVHDDQEFLRETIHSPVGVVPRR